MKWRVSAESSYSVVLSHGVGCPDGGLPYLQETVYYLSSYVVFMGCEERRLEELERAAGDVILGLNVFSCSC